MPAKEGDTVKILYKGFFDDGEVFDASEQHNNEPLEFTIGQHQVISGFENAVIGKEIDEEIKVHIDPKDAYGEYDETRVMEVKKSELPKDMSPEVGMILELQHQHGDHSHVVPAKILKVEPESIFLDMNHPLAGKALNFEITIKEIKS